MGWTVPRLFFSEDSFGTKYPTKIDMPIKKKETKPNLTKLMKYFIIPCLKRK